MAHVELGARCARRPFSPPPRLLTHKPVAMQPTEVMETNMAKTYLKFSAEGSVPAASGQQSSSASARPWMTRPAAAAMAASALARVAPSVAVSAPSTAPAMARTTVKTRLMAELSTA